MAAKKMKSAADPAVKKHGTYRIRILSPIYYRHRLYRVGQVLVYTGRVEGRILDHLEVLERLDASADDGETPVPVLTPHAKDIARPTSSDVADFI